MLAHAQRHSQFHAARLAHIDAEAFRLEDLEALPSMTKDDVMNTWDEVVTDPELHLQDVAAHLDALLSGEKTNAYLRGKYYAAATGGSSGKRGIFLWDWETFVVMANITYRYGGEAGPPRTAGWPTTDGCDLRRIVCAWEQVSFPHDAGPDARGASFSCRSSYSGACRRTQRIPAGPSRRIRFDHSGNLCGSARWTIENSTRARLDKFRTVTR